MKFSQRERKVIFFCLFLAVIFVAFVFVAKNQMSIILWWQEHFRKDVSFVSTLKEPNSYALRESLEREFTSILCIVGTSLAVFVLGMFFRKKEYASQSIPLKKVFFHRRLISFHPVVFFSYLLFVFQLIQWTRGNGFPYIYGPLFLILPFLIILCDIVFMIKKHRKGKLIIG